MKNNEEGKISEAIIPEKPVNVAPRKGTSLATFLAVIALILGGGGLVLGFMAYDIASKPLSFPESGTDGNTAKFTEGSIADVVSRVSDSVVSIVTSISSGRNIFGQAIESGAAGTGVIVSADGYILTNKHVAGDAKTITVVLHDGTTYENARLVSVDPLNDIAFIKIDGVSDLKAASLGDSKTITAGQQVVAIGNALGQYQNSVTSGIISGTGRSLTATDNSGTMSERLSDMIQTDAAINSGNSGGPLINAAGEVIGINTATSASGENVGFAIPIASVKGMLAQLIATGSAERAYLGVYSVDITPAYAKQYNLPVTSGTYVYSSEAYSAILSGSPAAKAGIQDKDIITAVNGVKIGAAGSLSTLIGEYKPGDIVSLTVVRDSKETGVKVELAGYKATK